MSRDAVATLGDVRGSFLKRAGAGAVAGGLFVVSVGPASIAHLPAAARPRPKQGEVSAVIVAVVSGYDVTIEVLSCFLAMGDSCESP